MKLTNLIADVNQPRQEFDPQEMKRLEASIKEKGVLQPLVVEKTDEKNKFLIIDGERRYRTCLKLGIEDVPVTIKEKMSNVDRLVERFHLQEQNKSWSAADKVKVIATLKEELSIPERDLADLLGLPLKTVQDYLLVSKLSKRLQNNARIPYTYLRHIATIQTIIKDDEVYKKVQDILVDKIEGGLVASASEVNYLQKALRVDYDATLNAILKSRKNDNVKTMLENAGLEGKRIAYKFITNARYQNTMLKQLKTDNKKDLFTETEINELVRFSESLNHFVNKLS